MANTVIVGDVIQSLANQMAHEIAHAACREVRDLTPEDVVDRYFYIYNTTRALLFATMKEEFDAAKAKYGGELATEIAAQLVQGATKKIVN